MDKLVTPEISQEELESVARAMGRDTTGYHGEFSGPGWEAYLNRLAPPEPPLQPKATTLPAAPEKRASAAPSSVSRRELYDIVDMIGAETGKAEGALRKELGAEIAGLRKEVGALKQDGEYFRDTNSAMGREMDAMKATVAQIKRDAELEKQLAVQRAQRRIESLEVALIAKGRSPYEGEDELPGSMADWRHAQ